MTENLIPPAGSTSHSVAGRIAILMCTFQGDEFLPGQLESIHSQSLAGWRLHVSDDHSTDDTRQVLERYRSRWGADRLDIRMGPGRGFVANFLSLACDPSISADYFAFCDQDDLWDADKLCRAMAVLHKLPETTPALYCARTRLIDEQGHEIGLSPLFDRPLSFANALVQSIAGGNTMVFNKAARQLLMAAGSDIDVQTHDWWLYIIVTGCGGVAHYDSRPSVGYRQHGRNQVGSNASWPARYRRARRLLAGNFRRMNDRNLAALRRLHPRMDPESLRVLREFEHARNASLLARITGIWRSGVYLHTLLGNLGLIAATLLKKL
jgi:glycosyltransferase involved in cell wall biosynthesis